MKKRQPLDLRRDSNIIIVGDMRIESATSKFEKMFKNRVKTEIRTRENYEGRENSRRARRRTASPFASLIAPTDPLAALYIAEERAHARRHKTMAQYNPSGRHVNGAIGIVQIIETGEIILTVDKEKQLAGSIYYDAEQQKMHIVGPLRACFPGGSKQNHDEDSRAALNRELTEETGINAEEMNFQFIDLVKLERDDHLKQAVFFAKVSRELVDAQLRTPDQNDPADEQLAIWRLHPLMVDILAQTGRMTRNHVRYWTTFKQWSASKR